MNSLLKNYKYRTREEAIKDLKEGTIFFAQSSHFHSSNDKLEGVYSMKTNTFSFSKTINDVLNGMRIQRGEPPIFGIRPMLDLDKIVIEQNNNFINQAKSLGIYCTSSGYDNQAMWVHYCKNEGVCFELEWDQKLIDHYKFLVSKVEYSDKKRLIGREFILKDMLVEFNNQHPDWSLDMIMEHAMSCEFRKKWMHNFVIQCSTIKRKCWEYEDEIRVLSPRSQSFPILKNLLKSVYMFIPGYNKPEFTEQIKKSESLRLIWVQLAQNYPEVKFYGLSFNEYGKLNREQLSFKKFTEGLIVTNN